MSDTTTTPFSRILAAAKVGPKGRYAAWKVANYFYAGHLAEQDFEQALRWYDIAAEAGLPLAQRDLAKMLSTGVGNTSPDQVLALYWYEKAARSGECRSMVEAGLCYLYAKGTERNVRKGIRYLERAKSLGDTSAAFDLAFAHAVDSVKPESTGEAYQRLLGEIDAGNMNATHAAGVFWQEGINGFADLAQAIHFFAIGAEKGHLPSMFHHGMLLLKHDCCDDNIVNGLQLILKAANLGEPYSLLKIGELYDQGLYFIEDKKQALAKYLEAAKHIPIAKVKAANILEGMDLNDDRIREMVILLREAAGGGCATAVFELARLFADAKFAMAFEYNWRMQVTTQAAELGHCHSQTELAMEELGLGRGNAALGTGWLEIAAQDSYMHAQHIMSIELFNGECGSKDIAQSLYYLHQSAYLNNATSLFELGRIFSEGKHVIKNNRAAVTYFEAAAAAGHAGAAYRLWIIFQYGKHGIGIDPVKADYFEGLYYQLNEKTEEQPQVTEIKDNIVYMDKYRRVAANNRMAI